MLVSADPTVFYNPTLQTEAYECSANPSSGETIEKPVKFILDFAEFQPLANQDYIRKQHSANMKAVLLANHCIEF